jgi:hypothetical protein
MSNKKIVNGPLRHEKEVATDYDAIPQINQNDNPPPTERLSALPKAV